MGPGLRRVARQAAVGRDRSSSCLRRTGNAGRQRGGSNDRTLWALTHTATCHCQNLACSQPCGRFCVSSGMCMCRVVGGASVGAGCALPALQFLSRCNPVILGTSGLLSWQSGAGESFLPGKQSKLAFQIGLGTHGQRLQVRHRADETTRNVHMPHSSLMRE